MFPYTVDVPAGHGKPYAAPVPSGAGGDGNGIEEARRLQAAFSSFRFGVEEALDLGADGRFDDPQTREGAINLHNALEEALK